MFAVRRMARSRKCRPGRMRETARWPGHFAGLLSVMHMKTHGDDTDERVRRRTAPEINARIDDAVERNVRFYGTQSREVISERIRELEREWDIERTLETNAASLSLVGLAAGILGRRSWLGLPVVVASFLLMHGIHGWCPPVPLFRRLGVRTRGEIERERYALKYLRGDFDHLRRKPASPEQAVPVVEAMAR